MGGRIFEKGIVVCMSEIVKKQEPAKFASLTSSHSLMYITHLFTTCFNFISV